MKQQTPRSTLFPYTTLFRSYEYKKREAEFIKEGEAMHEQYKQAVKNQDTKLIALLQSKDLNLQGRTVEFRKEFIKTQPKSIFSVMILSQMVDYKEITALEAFNYLEDIDSGLAEIEVTKELKAKLEILKKSDIGVKAPEFRSEERRVGKECR